MRFDIHTEIPLDFDGICDVVQKLDTPALLLDSDLRLVFRSRRFDASCTKLRRGMRVDSILPETMLETVASMSISEVLYTQVENCIYSSAAVVCGNGWYILLFNRQVNEFGELFNESYGKMSGYDIELNKAEFGFDKRDPIADRVMELLLESAERHTEPHRLPVFSLSAVINSILDESENLFLKLKKKIHVSRAIQEIVTSGATKDLAVILAYIVSFCAEHCNSNRFSVDVFESEGDGVIAVSVSTAFSQNELSEMFSIKSFENSKNGFLVYMIKLIADGNLWEFSSEYGVDGLASFFLRVPITKLPEEIELCDISPEYIKQVLEIFFGI